MRMFLLKTLEIIKTLGTWHTDSLFYGSMDVWDKVFDELSPVAVSLQ